MGALRFFIRYDERRKKISLTAMGWMVLALWVMLTLAVLWRFVLFPLRPMAIALPESTPGPTATPVATATPVVHEVCPSDPALWRTRPYALLSGKTLYALDPPCAMGIVEETYRELLAYRQERSTRWTQEDEARYYYYDVYLSPLTGQSCPAFDLQATWAAYPDQCWEIAYSGDNVSRFVFYTADPSSPDHVVLYVINPPHVGHFYNCETGEKGREVTVTAYESYYVTLIYNGGMWKVGLMAEEYNELPSDVDPDASILFIRQLQGR